MNPSSRTAITLPLLFLLGCSTTVPPQAVELSMAVGERIAATETSHVAFVTAYFDASRARIDDFIVYRWTPEFLETFVRDANLAELLAQPHPFDEDDLERLQAEFQRAGIERLDDAVGATERALGDGERGEVALEFARAAWDAISARRRELTAPLNAMEAEALDALRANYAQLSAMNGSVTGYLQSLVEVSEMQRDVLHRLQLQEERDAILAGVTRANRLVEQALAGARSAEDVLEELRDVLGVD